MSTISEVQEKEELDTKEHNKQDEHITEIKETDRTAKESDAARTLQRTFRGHRERRQLQGLSLDPSTRWIEAIKEARYRSLTTPRPRSSTSAVDIKTPDFPRRTSEARQNWQKIGLIARRAGGDDEDVSSSASDSETASQRQARREKRLKEKQERIKGAKMMDLQYFLEMVDLKHRYGSNLRTYHDEWKRSITNENFFYWLDYGEGKGVSMPTCTRERLDREQVRYLSREERMNYLTTVDKEGKLCWKRNGERIDTSLKWKDSIHGIVPVDDQAPGYSPAAAEASHHAENSGSSSGDDSSSDPDDADERKNRYVNQNLKAAKGPKKILHVSPATIFNQLLRTSVKKNTWIFVADTSFNLYIGIKQSGAFQHSSFLHGSRISAAGLIKIKDGQIRSLSPLSGHYRPPSANFRAFIHALQARGVDMSAMSVSKSYAVLLGLEGYAKTRKKLKGVGGGVQHVFGLGKDKDKDKDGGKEKEKEMVMR